MDGRYFPSAWSDMDGQYLIFTWSDMMINVCNLIKRVGGRAVIDNLSFSISKGERVSLFAPSGAGKSTLINILSGLDRKFAGSVSVKAEQKVTLFQEPGLLWYKSVQENILYPLKLNRIAVNREILKRYDEWMEITKLKASGSSFPYELSGGMKHKAAIVRAFLLNPDLILMDEPFNSIDMAAKKEIIAYIHATYPDITLLLVTHHPDEIPLLTNRVMLFREQQLSDLFATVTLSADSGLHDLTEHLFKSI